MGTWEGNHLLEAKLSFAVCKNSLLRSVFFNHVRLILQAVDPVFSLSSLQNIYWLSELRECNCRLAWWRAAVWSLKENVICRNLLILSHGRNVVIVLQALIYVNILAKMIMSQSCHRKVLKSTSNGKKWKRISNTEEQNKAP